MATPMLTNLLPNWGVDDVFLTHMKLNPARRSTAFLLASHQRVHAAVLSGFPTPQRDTRVLWRVDTNSAHDVNLLIASAAEPDLTHIIEQAGWPTLPEAAWTTRPYDPFLRRLANGQAWRFRLRANPVLRRRDTNGRIHTIPLTPNHSVEWLTARAEGWGFEVASDNFGNGDRVPEVSVSDATSITFTRRSAPENSGRRVTIASAQFDGLLRIQDAGRMRESLTQGLGRAKAYGCGLLTLTTPSA